MNRNLITRALFSLGLAATLFAPLGALASMPTDADLLGSRTVGVMPVLTSGPNAWGSFAVSMAAGQTRSRLTGAVHITLGEGGFGFGGDATSEDMRILKFGYYLGLVPAMIRSEHEGARDTIEKLRANAGALGPLGDKVMAAAERALASTERVDSAAFTAVFVAAQEGLYSENPRGYGYLVSGMWLGLSSLVAMDGRGDQTMLGMVAPLTRLLEEDAAFGSTDHAIARLMRRVAVAISQDDVSANAVMKLSDEVLQIKLSAPTAPAAADER